MHPSSVSASVGQNGPGCAGRQEANLPGQFEVHRSFESSGCRRSPTSWYDETGRQPHPQLAAPFGEMPRAGPAHLATDARLRDRLSLTRGGRGGGAAAVRSRLPGGAVVQECLRGAGRRRRPRLRHGLGRGPRSGGRHRDEELPKQHQRLRDSPLGLHDQMERPVRSCTRLEMMQAPARGSECHGRADITETVTTAGTCRGTGPPARTAWSRMRHR